MGGKRRTSRVEAFLVESIVFRAYSFLDQRNGGVMDDSIAMVEQIPNFAPSACLASATLVY
jgi:hypothetical protein